MENNGKKTEQAPAAASAAEEKAKNEAFGASVQSIQTQAENPKPPHTEETVPPVQKVLNQPSPANPAVSARLPYPMTASEKLRKRLLDAPAEPRDLAMLVILWAVSVFSANTLLTAGMQGVLIPMTLILLYSAFIAFYGCKALKKNADSIALLVLIIFISFGFLLNHEMLTNTVTLLTLFAAVPIQLMLCTGKSDLRKDGISILPKVLRSLFPYVFVNLDIPFRKAARGLKTGGKTGRFGYAMLGVLCTLPFLAVFGILFSRGDDAFARSLSALLDLHGEVRLLPLISSVVLGTLASVYLSALCYSLRDTEQETAEPRAKKGFLPSAAVSSFLTVLIALELYFGFFQIKYLFLQRGTLPEGESYADYARSGFFEIAIATLLTIALIFGAALFTKKREDGALPIIVRVLLTVFSGCVCLMFASSYYRMLMYIHAYAMTVKRVAVCWLMAVFLCVLFGVIVHIWKPKFALMRYTVYTVLLCVLVLNCMHVGGMVAKNNVDKYFETQKTGVKTDYKLDMNYLYTLWPSSAPELMRLRDTPLWDQNLELQERLYELGQTDLSWRAYNFDLYRAGKACADIPNPDAFLRIRLDVASDFDYPVCGLYFEYALDTPTGEGIIKKADGGRFYAGDHIENTFALPPVPENTDLSKITFRFFVILEDGRELSAKDMTSQGHAAGKTIDLELSQDAEYGFKVWLS